MVAVFREVRRVLRDDGVLWLNIGDSYASEPTGSRPGPHLNKSSELGEGSGRRSKLVGNLKPLDLVGIPWRLAMALQADGWYLRSDIIWSEPNPMPESVNGWRWERHKIKTDERIPSNTPSGWNTSATGSHAGIDGRYDMPNEQPGWRDCPGCPTCAPNDGLVLRRSAWRPTKSHEYVFLLSKPDRYFCDDLLLSFFFLKFSG